LATHSVMRTVVLCLNSQAWRAASADHGPEEYGTSGATAAIGKAQLVNVLMTADLRGGAALDIVMSGSGRLA